MLLYALGCLHPASTAAWRGVLGTDVITRDARALEDGAMQAAKAPAWTTEPWSSSGSGGAEAWCVGPSGPAGCLGASENRGVAWRVLALDTNGGADRIAYRAGEFPLTGDWGASVVVQLGAESDFEVKLVRLAGAERTDTIELGRQTSIRLFETVVSVETQSPSTPAIDELRGALASPTAFTAFADDRLSRLATTALAQINAGQIQHCSYNKYNGDGSPICTLVPIKSADAHALAAQEQADFQREEDDIGRDAGQIQALLQDLLPLPGVAPSTGRPR